MEECNHLIGIEHHTYEMFLIFEEQTPLNEADVEWFHYCPFCGKFLQ